MPDELAGGARRGGEDEQGLAQQKDFPEDPERPNGERSRAGEQELGQRR